MKFEKEFKIYNKVFTDSGVRTIWDFVVKQTSSSMSGTANIVVKNDCESETSEDGSIFERINFTHKNIQQIEINYASKDYESRIYVSISTSNYLMTYSNNYVKISGASKEWTESCFSQLRDIIECAIPTSQLVQFYGKWWDKIFCALAIIYPVCFFYCVVPIIRLLTIPLLIKIVIAIVYIVICIAISFKLINLIKELPNVVIDVNGKYREKQKKMAKIIWFILGSILIPVIIEVISKLFP